MGLVFPHGPTREAGTFGQLMVYLSGGETSKQGSLRSEVGIPRRCSATRQDVLTKASFLWIDNLRISGGGPGAFVEGWRALSENNPPASGPIIERYRGPDSTRLHRDMSAHAELHRATCG